MSEYLTTESEISELSEVGDEIQELLIRNNNLLAELEIRNKEYRDKEFEMSNTITTLTYENERLKQTIKSYDELIEFYKNNKDSDETGSTPKHNSRKSTSSEIIKSNLEFIQKLSELETKNFNLEQNEHNLKREIFTLNSNIEGLKFELEKLRENTEKSIIINHSHSQDNSLINENDIKELLQEIDDLKKEKQEVSEKALNIIAEKELATLELLSQLEELKAKHEMEINELQNQINFYENTGSRHSIRSNSRPASTLDLPNLSISSPMEKELLLKFNHLEEDYNQLKKEYNEKENIWEHERDRLNKYTISLENSHRSIMQEFEAEISKLKNEIYSLELEKGTLEKELITDKSSIENEIEHYTSFIKSLEEQKDKSEANYRNQISMLRKEMNELDNNNSSLRELNHNLEKQISELKNDQLRKIESIQEKWKYDVNIKEKEIENLKSRVDSLEKDKEGLKRECENNKKHNEKVKNEYKNLVDQLKKLKEMSEEEKKKWEEKLTTAEKTYENEKSYLKNQIKELRSNFESSLDTFESPSKKYTQDGNDINLMDYNSEENPSLLKNKIAVLESEVQKLNSLIKLKDNKNHNVFRLHGEVDILKKENHKLKTDLTEMKEMYEIQIKDLLQKVNLNNQDVNISRKSSIKPDNFNSKQLIDNLELEERVNTLSKENKFLNEQIEIFKKETEDLKILKDKYIRKLKEDLEEAEKSAANAKINLAQNMFEKDSEVIKYKRLCKKLKTRLTPDIHTLERKNSLNSNTHQGQPNNYHSNATPKKPTSFFQSFFNK
jgi:hypothetical protein